jgi:hypothetical protein
MLPTFYADLDKICIKPTFRPTLAFREWGILEIHHFKLSEICRVAFRKINVRQISLRKHVTLVLSSPNHPISEPLQMNSNDWTWSEASSVVLFVCSSRSKLRPSVLPQIFVQNGVNWTLKSEGVCILGLSFRNVVQTAVHWTQKVHCQDKANTYT